MRWGAGDEGLLGGETSGRGGRRHKRRRWWDRGWEDRIKLKMQREICECGKLQSQREMLWRYKSRAERERRHRPLAFTESTLPETLLNSTIS